MPAKCSAVVDTRMIYCGENLDQLRKLPDGCIDMIREECMLGYFVGFEFTGDALFEIDRFLRKEGREIRPVTVREILEQEVSPPRK